MNRSIFGLPLLAAVVLARLWPALTAAHRRDERGDVPGWVLITVMTAAMVGALWGFAEGELTRMLRSALSSVNGGG